MTTPCRKPSLYPSLPEILIGRVRLLAQPIPARRCWIFKSAPCFYQMLAVEKFFQFQLSAIINASVESFQLLT